ncbi:MAG: helix-turn-helix transcriptional regulator [Spirosomataceae bacterium]
MLTPRETEIVHLIMLEMTTEDIAKTLGISVSTVESHRRHLFKKLGVKSVVGLVKEAYRLGLTIP